MHQRIFLKVAALALLFTLAPSAIADISKKEARNAIAKMAGMSLPGSSVHANRIVSSSNSVAEVSADIQLAFRFEEETERLWRIREIRVAEAAWEDVSLFINAAKLSTSPAACDVRDVKDSKQRIDAALTNSRARCLVADLFGIPTPSDAVRIRSVSVQPLGFKRTAVVESVLSADFRLSKASGSWKVEALRSGSRDWVNLEGVRPSIDEVKRTRATDQMNLIAAALEAYRREWGSFIVTDKHHVLIDKLNPQFLHSVIRLDPWRKSYIYKGEANSFTLRSSGPDGKENTPDDVVISR